MNTPETNFAYQIRHALNERLDALPAATVERLAASRKLALTRRKQASGLQVPVTQTAAAGRFLLQPPGWLSRLGALAPIVIGIVLFIGLYQNEQQNRIAETAEIDMAVMLDDLPISAYVDHGFNAYLDKRVDQ